MRKGKEKEKKKEEWTETIKDLKYNNIIANTTAMHSRKSYTAYFLTTKKLG